MEREPGAVGNPGPDPNMSEQLIARVKDVARSIEGGVQRAPAPLDPIRLLVVDDNRDAADALAAVLRLLGCEVRACYDGPSALATVEEFRPDACLLDLMMPGMDGLELATRLKARAGPRPLLFVATTALGSLEDQTRTALAGFHYHLTKPVDTSALMAALSRFREVIDRRPITPPNSRAENEPSAAS
jgi:two-component system OmpR family response regulator